MKTLEQEAEEFCERTDEELGEYWSNTYDELPIQIAKFVKESKWVQAEKIKAQINTVLALRSYYDDTYYIDLEYERLQQQLKQLEDETTKI
jgi:hypothetical protein